MEVELQIKTRKLNGAMSSEQSTGDREGDERNEPNNFTNCHKTEDKESITSDASYTANVDKREKATVLNGATTKITIIDAPTNSKDMNLSTVPTALQHKYPAFFNKRIQSDMETVWRQLENMNHSLREMTRLHDATFDSLKRTRAEPAANTESSDDVTDQGASNVIALQVIECESVIVKNKRESYADTNVTNDGQVVDIIGTVVMETGKHGHTYQDGDRFHDNDGNDGSEDNTYNDELNPLLVDSEERMYTTYEISNKGEGSDPSSSTGAAASVSDGNDCSDDSGCSNYNNDQHNEDVHDDDSNNDYAQLLFKIISEEMDVDSDSTCRDGDTLDGLSTDGDRDTDDQIDENLLLALYEQIESLERQLAEKQDIIDFLTNQIDKAVAKMRLNCEQVAS